MGEQVAARLKWGRSSVGRAPALQAGGQEFESLRLHWIERSESYLENRILKLISSIKYLMSKKDEIGKYKRDIRGRYRKITKTKTDRKIKKASIQRYVYENKHNKSCSTG